MDINLNNIPKNDQSRFLKQAELYYRYLKAAFDIGVKEVTFWGAVDNQSWYELGENGPKQPDADALLFFDDGSPKLAYYALLMAYYQTITQ